MHSLPLSSVYVLGFALFILACDSKNPSKPPAPVISTTEMTSQPLEVRLNQVDTKDGIDEQEAGVLAESYFLSYEGSCGGIFQIRRIGALWVAETVQGASGIAGPDITIDARSGTVSEQNKPTVSSPWNEFREHLRAYGQGVQQTR